MENSYYFWFVQTVTQLVTQHSELFQTLGLNLFKGFATILIVWTGIQIALSSASGAGVRFDRFASLLLHIAFTFAMLNYYSVPIPGMGISFHKLITDQGADLAAQIEAHSIDDFATMLVQVYEAMQAPTGPSILDVMQVIRYSLIVIAFSLAQAAMLGVISYGFVAVGVCVLVGPIFIPFFIVPHMEWMFWGWLKALMQYSFYPVIGNAFVYVYAQVMINFFQVHPKPYDAPTIAGLFFQILMLSIAFVWGILKVPALTTSLFSGQSGDHAFPGIGWWR